MTRNLLSPFVLLVGLATAPSHADLAANASIVHRLADSEPSGSNISHGFAGGRGTREFFGVESQRTTTLWTTDGTIVGTQPLVLLCDDDCDDAVLRVASVGDGVALATKRGLWHSDGTPAGTRQIATGAFLTDNAPHELFPATLASTNGRALWVERVEGSEGLARLVAWDGSSATVLLEVDDPLHLDLFDLGGRALAQRFTGSDWERFETDGTVAGTVSLGHGPKLDRLGTALDGRWISMQWAGGDYEVVASTGAPDQDVELTAYSQPEPFLGFEVIRRLWPSDGQVSWIATDILTGWELWRSDGTVEGTVRVTNFGYADAGILAESALVVDGSTFVVADDGLVGCSVWRISPDGVQHRLAGDCPALLLASEGHVVWRADAQTPTLMVASASDLEPRVLEGCLPNCNLDLESAVERQGRLLVRPGLGPQAPSGLVEIAGDSVVRQFPNLRPTSRRWLSESATLGLVANSGAIGGTTRLVRLNGQLAATELANFGRTLEPAILSPFGVADGDVWQTTCLDGIETLYRFGGEGGAVVLAKRGGSCAAQYVDVVPHALGGGRAAFSSSVDHQVEGFDGGVLSPLPRRAIGGAVDAGAVVVGVDFLDGNSVVWASDGTAAGTVDLALLPPTNGIFELFAIPGFVALRASDSDSIYGIDPDEGVLRLISQDPLASIVGLAELGGYPTSSLRARAGPSCSRSHPAARCLKLPPTRAPARSCASKPSSTWESATSWSGWRLMARTCG
jgi:ELWxxDGT repeat protein